MGIIDRIILSIYTFLLAFLSLGVVLLALNLIPLDVVWTSIVLIHGQWEAALIGAVFLLVSVRLLLAGVRSRHGQGTIVLNNEGGDVFIALNAVENLVEKTARHIRGVRDVKVRVGHSKQALTVKIRAVVSPDSNIPGVTTEVQNEVQTCIKNTVGIDVVDIQILVENISNDFKTKQRVK